MSNIVFTVTNDLSYDQRMQRISTSLANAGFSIRLVGRKLPTSKSLRNFPFQQKRLYCFFKKGKLFYLEYNIRLFFFLLFVKADVICSIDLDTILPGFIISKIRRKTFVYDAHEYFTQVPEVVERPRVQRIWETIARFTIPKTKHAYTVCDSLAQIFEKEYRTAFQVIRNVPISPDFNRKNNKWNLQKPVILYQGALNEGRGLEEYLEAMQQIENAELWLAGEGDLSTELRQMAKDLKVNDKVRFLGYVEPADLRDLTPLATIGLNMLKNKGLSYYYSLSNKFLDYIQAGVPSVNIDFPEYRNIINQYKVGLLVEELDAKKIATAIKELLNNKELYQEIKKQCSEAAKVYTWSAEEKKLIAFYKKLEKRDHFAEKKETVANTSRLEESFKTDLSVQSLSEAVSQRSDLSSSKTVHLITFNIPLPANYGGVISVFYHIKALHELGAKIILHCFEYGREHSTELEKYCEKVYYYKRNMSPLVLLGRQPFIVQSRQHPQLLKNLLKDKHPIIFEGTHTCALLKHPKLSERLKIVRMHNVENHYYANLAGMETKLTKRIYFEAESRKLKRFEEQILLKYADHILAISPDDATYFKKYFKQVHYVPAFHPNETINCLPGKGEYVLYHGDLSVKDNFKAALYLIETIFKYKDTPFIIAGLNPPQTLIEEVAKYPNIHLKANVPKIEMEQLIQQAHINLLYTFHASGMKLKLLNALYNGRFCIVNSLMVQNTGIEPLCRIADTDDALIRAIDEVMCLSFGKTAIDKRKALLSTRFSNIENARITAELLY